jgi:hypothetical protein
MDHLCGLRQRWMFIALVLVAIASCGATSALYWPQLSSHQRLQAQHRWLARPFSSYRIAIRVEYAGDICSQELETKGENLRRIVYNNCRPTWLGLTTVARLFEISERLDRPQPCYSLSQVCTCVRVRQGDIAYDPQLGYPVAISYRREIRPNFLNIDYWRRVMFSRQLPNCGPINQSVRIAVTALIPLP